MGNLYYVLGTDGEPIAATYEEWRDWFTEVFRDGGRQAQIDLRKVAVTTVGDAEVSTVFLGLNHDYTSDGPPLLFETMIFGGEWDQRQWRYTLRLEALRGHERIVNALHARRSGPYHGPHTEGVEIWQS